MVRISPHGKLLATGGDDGHLRVWSFPDLAKVRKKHSKTDLSSTQSHPYEELIKTLTLVILMVTNFVVVLTLIVRCMILQHMRKRLMTLTSVQTAQGFSVLARIRLVFMQCYCLPNRLHLLCSVVLPLSPISESNSVGRKEGQKACRVGLGESCWREICLQGKNHIHTLVLGHRSYHPCYAQRVKFGCVEGDQRKYKVYTISNPVGSSKVEYNDISYD